MERNKERGRERACVFGGERGKAGEEEVDRISMTLKSKQGNGYHGSLQDGC